MAKGDLTLTLDEKDYQRLQAALSNLSDVDQRSAVQNALKQGMKMVLDSAKSNLSARNKKRKGNLMKSFSMQPNKKRAYVLGGHKRPQGAAAHLVNFGTNERWTKSGAYRGSVSKGNPNHGSNYFTDAVNTNGDAALQKVIEAVYEEIDRLYNKK